MLHLCGGWSRGARRSSGAWRPTPAPKTARRLEDATYTLCVLTGTHQLDTALYAARRQPADAVTRQQPPHH
ncbi:DUF5133 domain-containing protein [Streptomyces sp. NPDC050388]|uniref:DUF5133 domain-containing protein n=1 Tax=Streptomyces sp. NPDC050388 TaxID=3155781 RepID=UPI00342F9FA8